NGIIENAGVLRTALTKRGHVFRSETDTEVLVHLVEELHTQGRPLVDAVAGALRQVEGTYGIAVVSSREPETIVAARRGSPLRGHLLEEEGTVRLGGLNISDEDLLKVQRIVITACGTSWHSGLIGEYMMEELARIPTEVEYASEFRYRNPIVDERTLVVGISQSGETADTLAALREAKRRGARTLGLVNVVGSTIAREVDGGIYLHAGPEIGVASTKAFTSQIAALALLTLKMGRLRALSILQGREVVRSLAKLPDLVAQVLAKAPEVEQIAERLVRAQNVLYLGRGYNFPVALEGALKLKEISYIH